MRYENVFVEAIAHVLPERRTSSAELEARLAPLYDRLGLSAGRLELMSGITERRFWEPDTRSSDVAARAGARVLERAGFDRARIGCLVHASVTRDFLEPATASVVHHRLELDPACTVFDLSNACLGFANALAVTASMVEREEIEAALVVAGEDGGALVEATIAHLLRGPEVGRAELKRAHASLTIGSGAAAALVVHRRLASGRRRLAGGVALADSAAHVLCHGDRPAGAAGPLMETDSEALLHAGNALAARTWERFLSELGWPAESVERVVTHQVGVAHRRLTLETLGIDPARDFPTVERLGNIGSVSLPLTYDRAEQAGFVQPGQRVALLGIGSGLNCLMLGLEA